MPRILVADDSVDNVYSLKIIFQMMGNEVHVAYDGLAAFTMANDLQPDLILLDISMPKLNGRQVCNHIRETEWGEKMKIIAISGSNPLSSDDTAFNNQFVKPINFNKLTDSCLKMGLDINPMKFKLD